MSLPKESNEFFRAALVFSIFIGALIDILAIKWRWLMHGAAYMECLRRFIVTMVPNVDSQAKDNIDYSVFIGLVFVAYFTMRRMQIAAFFATHLFLMVFAQLYVYGKE